jgi:hypothetical protein
MFRRVVSGGLMVIHQPPDFIHKLIEIKISVGPIQGQRIDIHILILKLLQRNEIITDKAL